jgi:sporulation integral membrane protein YlbJ
MTKNWAYTKKAEHPQWGSLCLVFLLLFSFFLLLRRADVATACMQDGLSLCARAVVPSLFPFMVLSELLVASGTGEWLTAPLSRPLGKLLGLSRAGCCAVVLGLLCGFPVGARCAILAYEKGTLTRDECERAMACSSIPSSAFLLGTVGATLWQDARFGVFLYFSSILGALLSGILLYGVQKRKERERPLTATQPLSPIRFDAGMFPSAVKNATASTLLICAYVVFFSTLSGAVELILGRFGANENTHAILSALLELSGGVGASAKLCNRRLATVLTGAAVGWSGVSIHCQMLTLCDGHSISIRPYFAAKLVQATVCAFLMLVSILY